MGKERLSALAMIHTHYDTIVDLDEAVDIFARLHARNNARKTQLLSAIICSRERATPPRKFVMLHRNYWYGYAYRGPLSDQSDPPLSESWLQACYLTEHRPVVVLNGCSSSSCKVTSGVPLGSVLGPLLFLLYTNGLEEIALSPGTKFVLYADDILLYKPIRTLEDHHLFQSDLNAITNWLVRCSMTLNAAKCKCMLISRKRNSLAPILPPLCIGSSTIEKVSCMKYLGVLISFDLSWSAHIETVVSKARKALGCIYRRFYRNAHTSVLTKLYTTLVRPLLEYCCVPWDPHLEKDIEKLESVQKLACKICTKKCSGSYSELRHILGLPTIRDRRVFLKFCTMYKITNNIFCSLRT